MIKPLIVIAAALALAGCVSPATLHARYDVDCIGQSNGDQARFDACYNEAKAGIRKELQVAAFWTAAELASIDAKLDAQQAAMRTLKVKK
jgi:hypothetical protein